MDYMISSLNARIVVDGPDRYIWSNSNRPYNRSVGVATIRRRIQANKGYVIYRNNLGMKFMYRELLKKVGVT